MEIFLNCYISHVCIIQSTETVKSWMESIGIHNIYSWERPDLVVEPHIQGFIQDFLVLGEGVWGYAP